MKKIVIMVRNYKPYNSAVGICMSNISEELLKNNMVYVICEKHNLDELDFEIIDNERIIRFISKQTYIRKTNQNSCNSLKGFKLYVRRFWGQCIRVKFYLKFLLSNNSMRNDLVQAYYECLSDIDDNIDIIIPTCMPIESIFAAMLYCQKHNSIYIPVLFDKFATNRILQRNEFNEKIKKQKNLNVESDLLKNNKCKRFLYTKSWDEHLTLYHSDIKNKGVLIEHPLIKSREMVKAYNFVNQNDIHIVYAGTLTYNARNPEYTLKIIERMICVDKTFDVYFFGVGDAMSLVDLYQKSNRKRIINMGQEKTDVVHSAMKSADILLSIGNEDITQTPSKIFEYMSFAKPIIHIAKYKEDPVNIILKKYPYSFVTYVNEYNDGELIEKICLFIHKNYGVKCSFSAIAEKFKEALPQYSVNAILGD